MCLLATTHIVMNAPLAAYFLGENVSIKRYIIVLTVAMGPSIALIGTEIVGDKSSHELATVTEVVEVASSPRYYVYASCMYIIGGVVIMP